MTAELAFRTLPAGRGLVYLDSAVASDGLGRWSIIAIDPYAVLDADESSRSGRDPWNDLSGIMKSARRSRADVPGPFGGGAIGFLSYDLGRRFEHLPKVAQNDLSIPDLWFGLYDLYAVFDNEKREGWIVATGDPESGGKARQRAGERIRLLRNLLDDNPRLDLPCRCGTLRSSHTRSSYCTAVQECKDWIAAGHVYQLNLSHRFSASFDGNAEALYSHLRRTNPAPFAFYLDTGPRQILSTSPERFLWIDDEKIESRPIKGTRPRSNEATADTRLATELIESVKDRAELTMIIDLLRNDLGKVCDFGTVHTESLGHLESFETVHHLVGVIKGQLKPGHDACDAIRACFPGGSITGAPKIRAMEILEELEPTRRGIFYGSMGYLGFDGRADLNIAIRTALVQNKHAHLQVGGGIVADSDPESEYEETLHKAEGIFRALGPVDEIGSPGLTPTEPEKNR